VGQLHKRACDAFDLIPDEVSVYFDDYVSFGCMEFVHSYRVNAGMHLGLLWSNKAYIDG
jgi:hypothetical protein